MYILNFFIVYLLFIIIIITFCIASHHNYGILGRAKKNINFINVYAYNMWHVHQDDNLTCHPGSKFT